MKLLLSIPILFVLVMSLVSAQTVTYNTVLPNPGILPDNPLYFVKSIFESIDVFLTFNSTAKVQKEMHYADERLAEVQAMVDKNETQYIQQIMSNYKSLKDDAIENLNYTNNTSVWNKVMEKLKIHEQVLQKVENKCQLMENCKGMIGLEVARLKSDSSRVMTRFRSRPDVPREMKDRIVDRINKLKVNVTSLGMHHRYTV